MAFLLEPYVEIKWKDIEKGLVEMLEDHDFEVNAEEDPDFSKEFDFVEKMVPAGPDGRDSYNFVQVIVNAAMIYAVDKGIEKLIYKLIARKITKKAKRTLFKTLHTKYSWLLYRGKGLLTLRPETWLYIRPDTWLSIRSHDPQF